MLKQLMIIFKIDKTILGNQTINSFKKIPWIGNMFDDNSYTDKLLVNIFAFIGLLQQLFKLIGLNFLLTVVLLMVPLMIKEIFHVSIYTGFLFMVPLLVFFTTKTFKATESKYNNVYLLKLNAKDYCVVEMLKYLIFNVIILLLPLYLVLFMEYNNWIFLLIILYYVILYIVMNLLMLYVYDKTDLIIMNVNLIYYSLIGILIGFPIVLGFLGISLSYKALLLVSFISLILGVFLTIWLVKTTSIDRLYKRRFSSFANIIDDKANYLVNYRKEFKIDRVINKKYKDKKDYKYFNDLFIDRHHGILYKHAYMFGFVFLVMFFILLFFISMDSNIKEVIIELLTKRFVLFLFVLLVINCGPSITQAMYYHCDQAMLRYNFYKDKKTIIDLFFFRLKSIIKITFIPISVLIFSLVFLYLSLIGFNLLDIMGIIIGITMMVILFSVHYLGVYYLLQPYTNNMKNRSAAYMFAFLITFMIVSEFVEVVMPTFTFSIVISLITIVYFMIVILLVRKYASKTFKAK